MTALNKRWVGTTSDPSLLTNWAGVSLRTANYSWTASGADAGAYYLRTAANGDPGIATPGTTTGAITGGDVAFTSGTGGALAAGQFAYGDFDTLGYSTIYIQMNVAGDPDAQALDYIKLYQVPVATDHVRIPAGSGTMVGYDFSGVAIGDFIVEDGYTAAIGTATLPLSIDPDRFEWSGTGRSYINLSTAAISPDVRKTGPGGAGLMGLYLTGSALVTLTVYTGTVGVAWLFGGSSTLSAARAIGTSASIYLGKNVSFTTAYTAKGKIYANCAGTTANIFGGYFQTEEQGAYTAINAAGGASLVLNSTGTVGTLTMQSGYTGTVDLTQSGESRIFSSIVQRGGILLVDKGIVTVTAHTQPENIPQKIQVSNL